MSHDDHYDQPFDEEFDDSDAYVRTTSGYVGDAETLLQRAIDIIANAPKLPLSSSPRIDGDELIELLDEALRRMPEEMRHARWMIRERQEFVAKTRREADELLEAARVQAERMVQRTEVVRAAEAKARQVLESANADTKRMKNEMEDYLDQRLASFEIILDRLTNTIAQGRRRMQLVGTQPEPEAPATQSADATGATFFDVDETDLY